MSQDKEHVISLPGDAHEGAEQRAHTEKLAAEKKAKEARDEESK